MNSGFCRGLEAKTLSHAFNSPRYRWVSLDKRWLDSAKVCKFRITASRAIGEVSNRVRSAFVYSLMRFKHSRMCASNTRSASGPGFIAARHRLRRAHAVQGASLLQ